MKPHFWKLKVEELLHKEDSSLKKESEKQKKRNEIERLKKLNSLLKLINLEGVLSLSFFYFYKNNVIINLFFDYRLLKRTKF